MTSVSGPLLLLDLDGVIVLEVSAGGKHESELLVLHKDLAGALRRGGHRTIIVTHRSRPEAELILNAAGLSAEDYLGVIAAEDLLGQGLRAMRLLRLVRRGLCKTLALPLAERMGGVGRDEMILLDDRQPNLDALLADGVGMALKAPIGYSAETACVETFDIEAALGSLARWHLHRSSIRQINLDGHRRQVQTWQRSGLSTAKLRGAPFSRLRRGAGGLRRRCKKRFTTS